MLRQTESPFEVLLNRHSYSNAQSASRLNTQADSLLSVLYKNPLRGKCRQQRSAFEFHGWAFQGCSCLKSCGDPLLVPLWNICKYIPHEMNLAPLPAGSMEDFFGDREIHRSKPCVEATDSVAAPVAGASLRMAPFGGSSLAGNLYFHELVHYPLEHFQQGILCCYKIQ